MFHISTGKNRFTPLVGCAAACALTLAAVAGGEEIDRARFHSGLQKLADDAALAGVNELAKGQGPAEKEARHQAAFGASKSIIRGSGRTDLKRSVVLLSEGSLKVSVSLSAVEPTPLGKWLGGAIRTVSVASTAHYAAADPGDRSTAKPAARPLAFPGPGRLPVADATGAWLARRTEASEYARSQDFTPAPSSN